jgi:hypothetical protein
LKVFTKIFLFLAFTSLSAHSQVQAVRGYEVYDSVGVNTHWYFGNGYQYQPQFTKLVSIMSGAHIRHFRDGVYSTGLNTPAYLTQMYQTLANNGIHADLIVPLFASIRGPSQLSRRTNGTSPADPPGCQLFLQKSRPLKVPGSI